jgi:ribosomal protein S18 acetylase RimI-like enzyme
MGSRISVRRAETRDRASLEDCFSQLQTFETTLEQNRAPAARIRREYIDRLFSGCEGTEGAIFVAEMSSRVVGFVCVWSRVESEDIIEADRWHAYVTDLVVEEAYRRMGVASALMRAAEAHAQSHGAVRLRVGVLAANTGAHDLYRRLGYRDHDVILEKALG